ncbi:hypothetical protein QVD17_27658 [Tagetes erecta]|uniref:DUF674 family protein n=1 Tax=Tagetes erecta TaxID=13708 RepID=A0AAD8K9F8_TARER|nr:hypothetical protein QVD17_27658 [Tagetes erecta]
MAENKAKISIKVFVDKVKNRVLYAEADHTFVDILFHFLTLPMGTIVRLMEKHDTDKNFEAIGSFNNLYQSLNDLPEFYFPSEECKFMLLNPRSVSYYHCKNLKLNIDDTVPMRYYTCLSCLNKPFTVFFSFCNKAKCSHCGSVMNSPRNYYPDDIVGGGVFVSDTATYIVTDDLSVLPYTSESVFNLLTSIGVTDMSHLEERNLFMNRQQVLYLLNMALTLDSPLTHFVFHSNKPVIYLGCSCHATTFGQCDLAKKEASKNIGKILLKVSLQKSTGKFLFAETSQDFVDFVFGFLSLPLGTIIGTLMNGASSICSMDNLYKSISNLRSKGYLIRSQEIRDMLVKPHFGQEYSSINQIFPITASATSWELDGRYYDPKDPRIKDVYLKKSGVFFVTNDLVITPASSPLAMNTLNKLKVSFDDVKRVKICIGLEEALRMLKASLVTTSTLTACFENELK